MRRLVTEKDFNAIKTLTSAGMKVSQIVEILKFTRTTVNKVNKLQTFENYLQFNEAYKAKQHAKKAQSLAKKVTVEHLPVQPVLSEIKSSDEVVVILKDIQAYLHKLVAMEEEKKAWRMQHAKLASNGQVKSGSWSFLKRD